MSKISIALVTFALLASGGCKKKPADGAGTGSDGSGSAAAVASGSAPAMAAPDCAKAITNSMAVSKDALGTSDPVMLGKMKDTGIKSCTDDKWDAAAVTCMTDAKTTAEAQACYGKLTADQQAKMNAAAMALMPAAGAGSGSDAGSGSAAATGSGSGSAK